MAGDESGIKIYGEQRGAAWCDFDADGRVDLVVTENASDTRLYRNKSAKAGLRVRLHGPAGNAFGVGAVVRLKSGEKWGPAHEVHAGSGYWSSDSVVQVMSLSEPIQEIQVRWPGGQVTTGAVPTGAQEVTVAFEGGVK